MIQNQFVDSFANTRMNSTYPILIYLQNCLSNINSKKSLRDTKADIVSLVQKLGPQGQKYVIMQLFDSLEFPQCKQKQNCSHKVQLLTQLIKQYSTNANFLSYFPEIMFKINKEHRVSTFLSKLLNNLKIPLFSQVAISLSLYMSDRNDFSEIGQEQLIKKLIEVKKTNKGLQIPEQFTQQLLFLISRNPQFNEKLEQVHTYLLEIQDIISETRIINYFKGDWQYFANEPPIIDKPPTFMIKKVDYLKDLGPSATNQVETLKVLLSQVGIPNEQEIFQILFMMVEQKGRQQGGFEKFISQVIYANKKNTKNDDLKKVFSNEIQKNKRTNVNWNIDNFLAYCVQHVPNLKWQNVISHFDRPKLVFSSEEHFSAMMKAIEKIKKLGQKWRMPEVIYLKKWLNPGSQAEFLTQVFKCKQLEFLQLNDLPNKRVQKTVKDEITLQRQIWGYLDMIELLFEVLEHRSLEIEQLFEEPKKSYPELFLLSLSQIQPVKGKKLLIKIFSQILQNYLIDCSAHHKLLENLWAYNKDLMITSICEIFKLQSSKIDLNQIVEFSQIIDGSLMEMANWSDYEFRISLAIFAAKRQFFGIEGWLMELIEKHSNKFIKGLMHYIDNNLIKKLKVASSNNNKDHILEKAQLNVQLLNKLFFTVMNKTKKEQISPRILQYLRRMFKECCAYYPEVADGNIRDQIQKQTEREINRIYSGEVTVEEAIERMKKLKNSKNSEDEEQLASHLTFLCSELTYHHSYPFKELMLTADLFAGIVNANLIQNKIYQMFLHVLDSDIKEDTQKYAFAMKVMEQIKPKLSLESWFCEGLLDCELIMKKDPELVEELIKSIEPPKVLSLAKQKKLKQAIQLKHNPIPQPISNILTILPPPQNQLNHHINQITIDPSTASPTSKPKKFDDYDILATLDKTKKISLPDKQSKMSKINMACNTLSVTNVEEKAREVEKILDSYEAVKLLAYHIVFKRISITQNNGNQIFWRFVEQLPQTQKPVLNITYKILQRWFELTGKSINDKKVNNFKNIGSWLGKMTIGKGLPIPLHKLNLRYILISSFSKSNRLNLNISIILKILEHINIFPEAFRYSSPWLSRLIGTINQIEEKLKDDQNTKSQIKAFFKSIQIKVDNIPMPTTSYLNNNRIIISELDRYIVADETLANYYASMNIDLKLLITRAVDDSIQEIVQPVIDRAVKIAKVTTKQLILKDFAMQQNIQKFKECSYNVVKNMAGPLAHVTCRQPVKASLNRNLKNLLCQHISSQTQIDNIIQRAIADNLDFSCTLIKQAVIQSAEDSIKKDSIIHQSIEMRNKAISANQQFKDQMYLRQIPAIIPEELRPRAGGLSLQQYQIYRQFKVNRVSPEFQDKNEEIASIDRVIGIINNRGSIKEVRDILGMDSSVKDQLIAKINEIILKDNHQQSEIQYITELCHNIRQFTSMIENWKQFKEAADLKNKGLYPIIRKLVEQHYFPQNCLDEIEAPKIDENTFITLFQEWLETEHLKIEPYLQKIQEFFNQSVTNIKNFYYYSLIYAMQRVEESYSSRTTTYEYNYIENYSKLIIISYKTIAEKNCGEYLEYTLDAILQVFHKLMREEGQESFQRPFFKLFTNLIEDITRKEYTIALNRVEIFYFVLGKAMLKIAPLQYPNFSFAWVQLISNKNLIPALLNSNQYWETYYKLLESLFSFIRQYISEQHLYNKENGQVYQIFYKGILKLVIVMIHDFPDFLSSFSLKLCILPGPKFIQLTNMIISAYPRQMKFEFPLKIKTKNELYEQTEKGGEPIYYNLDLDRNKFKEILKGDPKQQAFRQRLAAEDDLTLQKFMLFVGWARQNNISNEQSSRKITALLTYTKDSLRSRLINFMVNLIRYPNSVTLFYINLALDMILKNSTEKSTRETLLANILVRMSVEDPHAWGLDYLVNQLIGYKSTLISLNVPKQILKLL